MATKWVRHGGDNAYFADAVIENIAARGFAALMRDLYQRLELRHAGDDFVERDNDFRRPDAIFFERHEFDEAHDDVFFAREHAEWDDLVFVESAQQNTIDLHRVETGTAGGADAGPHAFKSLSD